MNARETIPKEDRYIKSLENIVESEQGKRHETIISSLLLHL